VREQRGEDASWIEAIENELQHVAEPPEVADK
jgi:hypothetical protein